MPAIQFTKVAFAVVLALVVAPVQAAARHKPTHRHRHSTHARKLTVDRRHRAAPRKPIQAKAPDTSKPAVRATESDAFPTPVTASSSTCPALSCPASEANALGGDSQPPPCLVTVSICGKSGLLAGPDCEAYGGPVTEKTFVVGEQPEKRCALCMPPPPPEPSGSDGKASDREFVF
jgi:hypothetical protein